MSFRLRSNLMSSILTTHPSTEFTHTQEQHAKAPIDNQDQPPTKPQQPPSKPSPTSSPNKQKAKKRVPQLKIRWDRDYAITKELHQSMDRAKELSRQVFETRSFLDQAVFKEYWQRYLNVGIVVMCFRGRYGRYRRLGKWRRREKRPRSIA